jgi:hypothetical protein
LASTADALAKFCRGLALPVVVDAEDDAGGEETVDAACFKLERLRARDFEALQHENLYRAEIYAHYRSTE